MQRALDADPKTGDRTVPIPADLIQVLKEWLNSGGYGPEDLIFRTREDNRPSPSHWRRAWHLGLSKIDHDPLRPYDCRHTAATTCLRAGVPLGELARRLGHSVQTCRGRTVGDRDPEDDPETSD